jgi:hypothetical protein
VQSRIAAPAGLFPTADDRLASAGATSGTARFTREDERERTGGPT